MVGWVTNMGLDRSIDSSMKIVQMLSAVALIGPSNKTRL